MKVSFGKKKRDAHFESHFGPEVSYCGPQNIEGTCYFAPKEEEGRPSSRSNYGAFSLFLDRSRMILTVSLTRLLFLVTILLLCSCDFDMEEKNRCRTSLDCLKNGYCKKIDEQALGVCVSNSDYMNVDMDTDSNVDSDTSMTHLATSKSTESDSNVDSDADSDADSDVDSDMACDESCKLSKVCFNGKCLKKCSGSYSYGAYISQHCNSNETCSLLLQENNTFLRENDEVVTACITEDICWGDNGCPVGDDGAICSTNYSSTINPAGCIQKGCKTMHNCPSGWKCLKDDDYGYNELGFCSNGAEGHICRLYSGDCNDGLSCECDYMGDDCEWPETFCERDDDDDDDFWN